MSSKRISIVLGVDGAARAAADAGRVSDSLGGVGEAARRAGSATAASASASDGALRSLVQRAHAYLGVMTAVSQAKRLLEARDAFAGLQSRLDLLTGSAAGSANALQSIFAIAQRNGAAIDAVGTTYVRVGTAIKAMGGGALETARVVETVGAALRLNNATTAEADAVMRQFGQALAKGKVNGDEFVSLMENAPTLMDAVAQSLGKTKGELFKMAEAGDLTSNVFASAVLGSFDKLTSAAAQMPRTLGQASEAVANSFKKIVGESHGVDVASKVVIGTLGALSDNMGALAALGVAGLGVGLVVLTGRMGAYVASALAAAAANRAQAATTAALIASIGAETAAVTVAAAAKARLAAVGSLALRVIGGPVGLVATLVAGAAAWVAYKSASESPSAEQAAKKHIDQLRTETAEIERNTAARQANTAEKKQETRAVLAAAVANAQAALQDVSNNTGTDDSPAMRNLEQAQRALQEWDDLVARRKAAGKAASAVTLSASGEPLAVLERELKTRTGLLEDYAREVKRIAGSVAKELQDENRAASERAGGGRGGVDTRVIAAIEQRGQAAIDVLRRNLQAGIASLGADGRATANAMAERNQSLFANAVAASTQDLQTSLADNERQYKLGLHSLSEYVTRKYDLEQALLANEARLIESRIALASQRAVSTGAESINKDREIAALRAELARVQAKGKTALTPQQQLADNRLSAEVAAESADYAAMDALNERARQLVKQRQDAATDGAAALVQTNREAGIAMIRDDAARGQAQIELERSRMLAMIEPLRGLPEQYAKAYDAVNQAIVLSTKRLTEDLKPEWQRMAESWAESARTMKEAGTIAMRGIESAIDQLVTSGKINVKGLVMSILADLAKIQLRGLFSNLLGMVLGGATSSASGPGLKVPADFPRRAAGGPVQAGGTYLIGERGPELLRMGATSGHVTPNSALGGAVTVSMAPNIYIDSRSDQGQVAQLVMAGMAQVQGQMWEQLRLRGVA